MSPNEKKASGGTKAKAAKAESAEKSPEQIRVEIGETRAELGDTVEAVAEKTDVKAQAQAKVDEKKAEVRDKVDEAKAKAQQLGEKAKAAAPETPAEGAQQAQAFARENPKPLAIAGAVVALLLLWRLLRR